MVKFGLLAGVLIVGIVLIIVGAGGPSEPTKVGGVVPKKAQEEYDQSKSTYRNSLLAGIGVCILAVGGFALMFRSWMNSPSEGEEAAEDEVAAEETPPDETPEDEAEKT